MVAPPTPTARSGSARPGRAPSGERAKRRLPRGERRAQLVRVAAGVFLERGFEAATVDAVAEAAGVTRLIVYRIFGSKEALYQAVLGSVTRPLVDELDPPELGAIVPVVVRVARQHPDAFRLLWRKARFDPNVAGQADIARVTGVALVDASLAESLPDDVMRAWLARSVVEYVWSGVCTWLDVGDPTRDAEFAQRTSDGARALCLSWMSPESLADRPQPDAP